MDRARDLRDAAHREQTMLHDRTNIFLLWNSILLGSQALAPPPLALAIGVCGLAGTLMWLYVGLRSIAVYDYFFKLTAEAEAALPPEDRIETNAREWRDRCLPRWLRIRVTTFVAILLPALWVLTWAIALVFRLLHV